MKSRAFLAAAILVVLCALPTLASAAFTHYFNCEKCHRSGAAWGEVASGGICIDCHSSTANDTNFNGTLGRPVGGVPTGPDLVTLQDQFVPSDASNAMGSNAAALTQTSHNWGAPGTNAAAGAKLPTPSMYAGGSSYGRVTCYVCHDPHGAFTNDPDSKLLRTAGLPDGDGTDHASEANVEAMCVECHKDWSLVVPGDNAFLSHPLVPNYETIRLANPDKYKVFAPNGQMALLGNKIGCSTCHGTHFVDSNAATTDGLLIPVQAVTGDGKLLKGDGAAISKTALCTSCHTYTTHPSSHGNSFGCLDCHSGHAYNKGTPNFYVLRDEVAIPNITDFPTRNTTVTGILYDDLLMTANERFVSYCVKCHGSITDSGPGGLSQVRTHTATDNCASCHKHNNTFKGGCIDCHGSAPSLNVDGSLTEGGYAHSTLNPANNYSAFPAVYKDESQTPHAAHANAGKKFGCEVCHGNNAYESANHDSGSFQNVLDLSLLTLPDLTTNSGALSPTYNTAGAGTCNAVYCHSNGVTGLDYVDAAPTWALQAGTIVGQPNECQSCHGNDVTSMTGKKNSAAHLKHLARYSCNVCHDGTANNSTSIADLALHVNKIVELSYDNTFEIGNGTFLSGTAGPNCAVYCHSNGGSGTATRVDATPVWATASTGACGTCHQYSDAGVATGSGAALGGSHATHLYAAGGPKAACDACHTNVGTGADHVNGEPSLKTDACLLCHGATNLNSGYDVIPTWGAGSISCDNCHLGVVSVIGGRSPSSKANTYTSGHNFPGPGAYPDGVPAANKACTDCHDANGAGHLNGSAGDMRLNAGFSCTTCHTTKLAHRNKDCFACHDPHGTSNWGMVHDSQAKQNLYDTSLTDKFSGNVVFLGRTGADSYEENDGVTNGDDICATCHATTTHNNRAGTGVHSDGLTHSGEDCFICHNGHEVNPPFSGNANTCEGCHSNLATKGAHAAHMNVLPDIVTDRSECALCHVGADTYTTAAGGLHRNGSINVNVAIGYDGGTGACATACHKSSVGDGFWTDTALDCSACHYYAANPTLLTNDADTADKLTGDHSKHFGLGSVVTCADCHTVPAAGDTTHISDVSGADQGAVLTGKATALQNEAAVTATLLVSGTEDDTVPGNETCNNTACHNPSGLAKSAQWNISIADCTLCHSNTDPTTGSHTEHMGAVTLFGINTIACTSCHVNNGTNNAHRNGSVTFAAGMNYTAGAEVLGLATVGACTTTACHNNGTVAATAVPTPTWGVTPADACAICHGNAPATAKHAEHVGNTAYVAGSCSACHTAATVTTHINGSRNMLVTVPYNTGNQTCTNSCHLASTAGDWTLAGSLACLDCHAGTYVGGNNVAKGFNAIPATGLHAGTLTTSANTHDDSFKATRNEVTASAGCATCHTATPSSNHIDGTFTTSWNAVAPSINFAAAVQFVDNATAPTCGPNAGLVGCHDDDGAWKRKWSLTARNSNGTECANCHGTYDLSFVTGMAGRHQTTTSGDAGGQIAASHDGTDKCYTCHAFKSGDTTFYNFATKHRDGAIQINSNVTLVQNVGGSGNVGCTSCHVANDGINDGQHQFQDVVVGNGFGLERWNLEQITGPSADCNSCHTLNGRTHAGATENATLHDLHIANQYNVAGCVQCHSNAGPGHVDHNNGTVNFGGTYMSASVSYGPAPGTVDFGGTCAGAGVNGCHNAPAANDWADWTAVTSSIVCADCHNAPTKLLDQGAWPPASNLHGQHLGDAYLTTEQCSECHGANAKDGKHVGHKDTGADFGGALTSYTVLDGTCANTCHYVVNGRDWTSATPLQCADCHNADVLAGVADGTMRLDQNGYPPTSGEHTPHLGNNALVPGDCADCHGANAVTGAHTGHLNMAKTVAASVTSYDSVDPGAGTCVNSCHAVVDGRDWTSGTTLFCADCHNADGNPADLGTFTLDQGNYPPSSAKHAEHLANNTYVPNDCTDCHGATATAGTHVAHKNGSVQTTLTYVSAAQTCTNSCHLANTSGDWTAGGALVCLDCHAGSYIGGNNVAKGFNATPTTGLHAGTLTITNNTHDDSFNNGVSATAGTCASCHTATPSTNHMDGTYTSSYNAVAPSINFAATVGFADAATPTCGPNGAQVACHDDGGAWKRKWSTTARNDATPLNECANCHGDFATGFVTGMALRHQVAGASDVDGQVASSHDTCSTCHTYKDGDASFYTFATQHRDGSIQLNNGMGFTDAGALVGCSGCHVATGGTVDEGHQFQDTNNADGADGGLNRWTRTLQAGPAADCAGCHDSILGTAHASANESLATHNLHTTSLYYDDVTAKCTMCHENNGSGVNHNNGTVNFANNMSNTLNYPRTGYATNCATANGCHSSDNGEWVAGNLGGDACADCHVKTGTLFTLITSTAYAPNTGAHAVHNANTSFVGLNDCSECHGANAHLGTHAAHKDKTLNNTVTYASASGTCTNTCHVVADGRDWTSATALACADCHNAAGKTMNQGAWPPVSNKHTKHVGTAANAAYGDTVNHATAGAYEFGCGICHTSTAANHFNGAINVALTNWTAVGKTCGQNSCHQNGAGAAPAQTVDWDAVPGYTGTDVCAICHLNSPSTAAHSVHVQGIHSKDIYTGATGLAAAGLGATASHGNEAYSTTLNCDTCHNATVTARFNDKNTYCDDCHGGTAPLKGTMTVNVKSAHINIGGQGSAKVQFRNVQVRSKAQLRDNLADASLNTVWTRTVGYKASGAYDLATASLTAGTFAGNSCSNISCHNNQPATWAAPANNCMSCHTSLPR